VNGGHARRGRGYGLAGFAGQVTSWVALLGFGGLLLSCVLVPKLAGATPYTVLTGSMTPALPPGTLAIVRPAEPGNVAVGDVVTYQLESGQSSVVTHRVVSVGINGKGEYVYRTQGDANDVADDAAVRAVQIRGKLWYAVPYVGHLAAAIDGRAREAVTGVVTAVLLAYGVAMFVGAARERRGPALGRHRRRVAT
jgi:signal peptidase